MNRHTTKARMAHKKMQFHVTLYMLVSILATLVLMANFPANKERGVIYNYSVMGAAGLMWPVTLPATTVVIFERRNRSTSDGMETHGNQEDTAELDFDSGYVDDSKYYQATSATP